jgi:glutamine kinase
MQAPLAFSTKARTLALLGKRLGSAEIAELAFFTVAEWGADRASCLARAAAAGDGPWIVRSSCRREDGTEASNAGAYLPRLDVDKKNLAAAIEAVIASYGEASPLDEVLVQPMLRDVVSAGVALSHDPNTGAPYRSSTGPTGPTPQASPAG